MHRTIGGTAPLEPGYRTILVAPQPGGHITWAEASLDTPQGNVRVRWDLDDGQLNLQVTVPDQARAVVRLPGRVEQELVAGAHAIVAHT